MSNFVFILILLCAKYKRHQKLHVLGALFNCIDKTKHLFSELMNICKYGIVLHIYVRFQTKKTPKNHYVADIFPYQINTCLHERYTCFFW